MDYRYNRYVTEHHECLAKDEYKQKFVRKINDIIAENCEDKNEVEAYKIFDEAVGIDFDALLTMRDGIDKGRSVDIVLGVVDYQENKKMLLVELKLDVSKRAVHIAATKEKFENSIQALGKSIKPLEHYAIVYGDEYFDRYRRSHSWDNRDTPLLDQPPYSVYNIAELKKEFFE